MRTLKVGVESFNECVRRDVNKPISKEEFDAFIDRALNNNISNLHFYLIYGLEIAAIAAAGVLGIMV